jgi:hypothetical protein
VFELEPGCRCSARRLYRILEFDQGGTGPLEIDRGGTRPLEIDHGGTGPLEIASVAWDIVKAFSPIALVSTSSTNTTTINHLFMDPSE